jgi:hypothetical protein
LCIDLHIFEIRWQREEEIVTLAMLHVDRARTRMPLVCTVISMLVLVVFGALGFVSRLIETNTSAPDFRGATSAHMLQMTQMPQMPQMNASAQAGPEIETSDLDATESWVRHAREF